MMWPPCLINYAWWAKSNDTSLNFLALREPSETPLPVGHQNFNTCIYLKQKASLPQIV
jgi:hypothetical protein